MRFGHFLDDLVLLDQLLHLDAVVLRVRLRGVTHGLALQLVHVVTGMAVCLHLRTNTYKHSQSGHRKEGGRQTPASGK